MKRNHLFLGLGLPIAISCSALWVLLQKQPHGRAYLRP